MWVFYFKADVAKSRISIFIYDRFALLANLSLKNWISHARVIPVIAPMEASENRRKPFSRGGRSGDFLEITRTTTKVIVAIRPLSGIPIIIHRISRINAQATIPTTEKGVRVR